MDISKKLTEELGVQRWQAEAAVKLIDEGNTIPFIARYRKEATGSLNDEVLRNLGRAAELSSGIWRIRRIRCCRSIRGAGKADGGAEEHRFEAAETLVAVDDLYRPYRPKRRTRAMIAKEKGLEGLADVICCR